MKTYGYMFRGTAAEGKTWELGGVVECAPGELHDALQTIFAQLFQDLTKGKAIFGKPGFGCKGPYQITRFVLDLIPKE